MSTDTPGGPSWYDILGVGPDASPDEIKAAWRTATDKFEPGSGTSQFRLFNEAADVLLDPDRRAAYDAELAAARPDEIDSAESESAEPVAVEASEEPETPWPVEPAPVSGGLLARLARTKTYLLALLAVLTVAVVAAAVLLALDVNEKVAAADDSQEASAVAERALNAVLSYDYRQMEADRDRAVKFLTPAYEKEYLKTFGLLTEGPDGGPGGVVTTKTVVSAQVLNTGIVDAEPGRVRVLVFVNQSSAKGDEAPAIFQNRVVATMVERDGTWLVDDLKTY